VKLFGDIGTHLKVHTPLLDDRNNLVTRIAEQKQRHIVFGQGAIRNYCADAKQYGNSQQQDAQQRFPGRIQV
jgi:hypothetical protein